MSTTSIKVPSSTDACTTIVRALMCYRLDGESEKFCRRAIESLVKKLKDKRDELDSLIMAVTSSGSQPGKCVTILRTLDGRLQISGRKVFPHVVYAKIWRWSQVGRMELAHERFCKHAYDLKDDLICVNPYHYQRIISSGLGVTRLDFQPSDDIDNALTNEDVIEAAEKLIGEFDALMNNDVDMSATMANIQHHSTLENLDSLERDLQTPQPMYHSSTRAPIPIVVEQMQFQGDPLGAREKAFPSENNYTAQTRNALPEQRLEPKNKNAQILMQSIVNDNQNVMRLPTPKSRYDVHNQNEFPNTAITNLQHAATLQQPNANTLNYKPRDFHDKNVRVVNNKLLSNQPVPEYWCSISYFELDAQVGETFKVNRNCSSVTIDGYVDPSGGNRFCLGALSNVHRTEQSEKTRLHIGRGVVLELHGEGDIWLRCASDHSVFVQSHYLDVQAGRATGNTVHKIFPAAYTKVFDLRKCYIHMKGQVTTAQSAAAAHAAAVEGRHGSSAVKGLSAVSGIGVDDLRRLCILRLSFVKGWGPDYHRHSIKETPCWIEVNINRALQLLDEVLNSSVDGSRSVE